VLAAGLVQHRRDLLDGLDRVGGNADARDLILGMADTDLQSGGSCIIAPDGTILAETGAEPDLLIADLDLHAMGAD
jgi:predicted amidohydrolase